MQINENLIEKILGYKFDLSFSFDQLGLSKTVLPNSLSFLDNEKFKTEIVANPNIAGLLVDDKFIEDNDLKHLKLIKCIDPRHAFYSIHNFIGKANYKKITNNISPSVKIHPSASIAATNVIIGANTEIHPNVVIHSDVIIGENCVIRSGAVVGIEGFEYKKTSFGILPVFHDGKVLIGNNVEIGGNTCIDKGFSYRHTSIDDHTKIDNLVHIAHGVNIGRNCFIIASSMIAGSVTIGDDVWVSPNSSIAPYLTVGNGAFISLGSVVTKNVLEKQQVTGNFAIDHQKFLENFKKTLK